MMALAERAGLSELIGERVAIKSAKVASAASNPAGKLIDHRRNGCGADCIDDLDVIRSGGC